MQMTGAITVSSASVKLWTSLAAVLNSKQQNEIAGCDISVQTNDIIIRTDGTDISGGIGMLIKSGTIFRLTTRQDILNCIMQRSTADATVVAMTLRSN